eukprot:4527827-Pyramimonas_sp.AAC.1
MTLFLLEQGFTEAQIRHWWSLKQCMIRGDSGRAIRTSNRRDRDSDEKRALKREAINERRRYR